MSTVETVITLFNGHSMADGANTPPVDTKQFITGMIIAAWTANDALNALLTLQGSGDKVHWGDVGIMADDVGSVTINTVDDSQQWAFQGFFPFRFLKLVYAAGGNTAGALDIKFTGYSQGSQ